MMLPVRCTALVCAAFLAACAEPAPPPAMPPPPPFAPLSPAPPPPVDTGPVIQLPFSTSRGPLPAGVPLVLISRQSIAVQGDPGSLIPVPPDPSRGADAAYKRSGPNDLYIVPLAAALARSPLRAAGAVAIGADAAVPYRVLVEVLFTAGQSEIGTFHLLVRTAAGVGAITTHAPRMGDERRRYDVPSLNLSVIVVRDGMSVKTSFGNIATGCAGIGSGLAFPRGPAGLDLAGLQACATALRQRDPRFAGEQQATLTANPDVPLGEIVSVMDALRTEPSGRAAFPDIVFAVPR